MMRSTRDVTDSDIALERIRAARERANAATSGPWHNRDPKTGVSDAYTVKAETEHGDIQVSLSGPYAAYALALPLSMKYHSRSQRLANVAFIAHARTDVPLLADAAEALVRLAEAIGYDFDDDVPWWWCEENEWCIACHWGVQAVRPLDVNHAPDCPAMAAEASISALMGERR
jgi:hypothetical protein